MLKHVVKREFTTQSRSKAYIISMVVTVALIFGAAIIYKVVKGDDSGDTALPPQMTFSIGVEKDLESYVPFLQQQVGEDSVTTIDDGSAAEWLTATDAAGGDDVVLALGGTPDKPEVFVIGSMNEDNSVAISLVQEAGVMNVLSGLPGGDDPNVRSAITDARNPGINYVTSENANLMEKHPQQYFVVLVAMMLLYFAIVMGIAMLSTGVVEEKSSRVVEILLAAIRPRTLLLGKILGIGAFILIQMAVYLAAIVIALKVAGINLPIELGPLAAWLLVWVVAGYFTYAALTGGLAATVSRQEDIGAITTPLIMISIIPMYMGMYLVPYQPEAIYTKIFSWVPLFSPFLMPARQAFGIVEMWEVLGSLAVTLIAIPLLAALAGKIYENSILRTGQRVKILTALRGKD